MPPYRADSMTKKQVPLKWQQNKLPLPPFYQHVCVHDLVKLQAQTNPRKCAITYQEYSLSYKELNDLSNQLANLLKKSGVKAFDKICVLLERTPLLIVTMLAIFKVGGIYVPVNPKYPQERIQFILDDCGSSLIIVDAQSPLALEVKNALAIDDAYSQFTSYSTNFIHTQLCPDDIAYIIYTSGTTGNPKGVLIKHASLINLAIWYRVCFNLSEKDRASQFASQSFDTFFCETIPFLVHGNSIHMISDADKLTPQILMPWLAEQRITICDLPTAYAQILFSLNWPTNLCLRILKIGGESILRYPNQILPFDIWNTYGPTEATVETTFVKIYEAKTPPEKQSLKTLPPPIGKPLANAEVYVVDEHLKPVPIGVKGELLIGGIGISAGYLNRPELTNEKFIPNIFNQESESTLYKTGDLVLWNEDGNLEFAGRIDNQVKIRGYRIELNEIQMKMSKLPDINEVVVITTETDGQKSLVAYLVPDLEKIRIPYEERCLLATENNVYFQCLTENFSKEGAAITCVTEKFNINESVKVYVKFPGMDHEIWVNGRVMWQQNDRMGIKFESLAQQKKQIEKSVEYFLSANQSLQTLNNSIAKRSLRRALKKLLPDYMIPSIFTVLPEFPLTFNGKVDLKALPPPIDIERSQHRNYVEPATPTEKALVQLWSELLNHKKISINENFYDIGGNSLLISQLFVKILNNFHVSIPVQVFLDSPYISTLAHYIDAKGTEQSYLTSISSEINQDIICDEKLIPHGYIDPSQLNEPTNILLTGASGFLGVHLLSELIENTQANIYCLVRRDVHSYASERLMANVKKYKLEEYISLPHPRIIVIPGDFSVFHFGISEKQYDDLAHKIDAIYHCGAEINMLATYSQLRASNVVGTLEIIKFAIQAKDKVVHHVSTVSAAVKRDEDNNLIEEFPDARTIELVGGYPISKWVAECLLTQMKDRKLPVYIYRIGTIWAQSDTGLTNTNDSLLFLLKGCIQLGYAPNWNYKVTFLPVDFVSEALIGMSLHQSKANGVFQLDHPAGIIWTDLIAWLNEYGYKIKIVTPDVWRAQLKTINQTNALYPFLPFYLSEGTDLPPDRISNEHTAKLLKSINVHYPVIDDELLRACINYLAQKRFLPRVSKTELVTSDIS